ncbi:6-phospho-3-hexuloisomerase [Fructilactobacillus florum]|uniref:6-phospho-3-hexuloisomerase n=1 Tax=Fructilactobacillus florum TaxID=640331 RepID=UPI00028C1C83|nr:6-phospho-3-hexuloisomerase [Fructilactobacillus florum]EKK21031.1 6-phospho-3-hexuloisomerase [Fructilactobacillus florum 2F]
MTILQAPLNPSKRQLNNQMVNSKSWQTIIAELAKQPINLTNRDCEIIEQAPRIFVAGGGRSGLAIKALAMRLMQLGKTVFVVGETTTPAIQEGDLLVLASASGTTPAIVELAQTAQKAGAVIWLFSTNKSNPIATIAKQVTLLPGKSKQTGRTATSSQQPLGSLFEQSVWIFGDALVLALMNDQGITEQELRSQHANLE